MRSLRLVGLVFTLLIVGVLGGLTAPLPSEAASNPTFKIKIDTATAVPVALTENCTATQKGAHTRCFRIATGVVYTSNTANNRQFTIQPYSTQTPLLLVDDIPTTANATDGLTVSGMQVAPVSTDWGASANNGAGTTASNGEQHAVEIIVEQRFDFAPDTATNRTNGLKYKFGLRASGVTASLSGGNVSGDFVRVNGTGTFTTGGTAQNISNAGNPNAPTSPPANPQNGRTWKTYGASGQSGSFSFNQTTAFPAFDCYNGASLDNPGTCTPTITLTLHADLRGLERLEMRDSMNIVTARSCDLNAPRSEFRFPLLRKLICFFRNRTSDQHITAELAEFEQIDQNDYISTNTPAAPECPEGDCPCSDSTACGGGSIVINKTTDPVTNAPFDFTGTGDGISDFSITTNGSNCGECPLNGKGSSLFSGLTTGLDGGVRTITETGFPFAPDIYDNTGNPPFTHSTSDHDAFWWTRNVSCVSTNNPNGVSGTPPLTNWETFIPTYYDTNPSPQVSNGVNDHRGDLGVGPPPVYPDTEVNKLRQGKVVVYNLMEGDTLTCKFENRLFNDDASDNIPPPVIQ